MSRLGICLHCKRSLVLQARLLCSVCHENHSIRVRYPKLPASNKSAGALPDFNGAGLPPKAATSWPPGSEEKIAVLMERAANGQALHHPRDRRFDLR